MSKKQKTDHVVWTNRKARREVQLLSGASVLILSLVIICRFMQGEVPTDIAFGIGLGFGMILALLIFSMAPLIRVQKRDGGGAVVCAGCGKPIRIGEQFCRYRSMMDNSLMYLHKGEECWKLHYGRWRRIKRGRRRSDENLSAD